jgi:hypothetical protein
VRLLVGQHPAPRREGHAVRRPASLLFPWAPRRRSPVAARPRACPRAGRRTRRRSLMVTRTADRPLGHVRIPAAPCGRLPPARWSCGALLAACHDSPPTPRSVGGAVPAVGGVGHAAAAGNPHVAMLKFAPRLEVWDGAKPRGGSTYWSPLGPRARARRPRSHQPAAQPTATSSSPSPTPAWRHIIPVGPGRTAPARARERRPAARPQRPPRPCRPRDPDFQGESPPTTPPARARCGWLVGRFGGGSGAGPPAELGTGAPDRCPPARHPARHCSFTAADS